MQLELKHLAPYLPYGLEVEHEGHIAVIVSLYLPAGHPNNHDLWIVSMEDKNDRELSCGVNFKEIQPILRPLSDLTKEIEEGKKPIAEWLMLCKNSKGVWSFDTNDFSTWELTAVVNEINLLFKNHFDVFGLIEKGLAIDINTL